MPKTYNIVTSYELPKRVEKLLKRLCANKNVDFYDLTAEQLVQITTEKELLKYRAAGEGTVNQLKSLLVQAGLNLRQ